MNSPIGWALVVHIIGLVFWVGGLLTGTVVMAAHAQETSPEGQQALARLEKRLIAGFANPGAVITVIAGILMLWIQPEYLHEAWLHFKLGLVVVMLGLHVVVVARDAAFREGKVVLKRGECMALHGMISLVFLGIVILAVVKPL